MRSSSSEHATLQFRIIGWSTPLILVVLDHSPFERLVKDIDLRTFELAGTDSALAFLPPRPRAGHPHAHPGQSHDRHPRICELSRLQQTASPLLRPRGKVRGTTQRSPRLGARTSRSENRFSFQFVSRCARDAIWLHVLYLSAVYERTERVRSSPVCVEARHACERTDENRRTYTSARVRACVCE